MIVFGIFLLIVAVMNPELVALWGIGIIAIFVGMVLAVAGAIGRGGGVVADHAAACAGWRLAAQPVAPRRRPARSCTSDDEPRRA